MLQSGQHIHKTSTDDENSSRPTNSYPLATTMSKGKSPYMNEAMASTAQIELRHQGLNDGSFTSLEENHGKASHELSRYGSALDGGFRAWFVTVGGCMIFFCCLGFGNSFGVFEEYYLAHQLRDLSPDQVAWIGSISTFLQFAAGALGGPLFDRYGVWVIRVAAVAYLLAMMMLSFCTKYWQVMLVQGVFMGTIFGLLLFAAMGAVVQYFEKLRSTTMGLVVAGASIGGIIMPIALSKMLNGSTLGFGWSVRVIGFLILPLLVLSSVSLKPRLPPRTSNFFIISAFRQLNFVLLIISIFFQFFAIFIPLFYIPKAAVARGVDPTLASYLIAILNAASTFGRIVPGILGDRIGKLNMLSIGGLTTGIVLFWFNQAKTTTGLVVFSVAIGFTSGTIMSGSAVAFATCTNDPRSLGTYMGEGMAVSALAVLIGPPISGALLNHYGGFFEVAMFSGSMCTIGGLLVFLVKANTPQGVFGRV